MTDIIDLSVERDKRSAPDPEFIRKDGYGRPMYVFLLSYEMDGSSWCTKIWAYDFADAEKRIAGMRASLKVDGQLLDRTPA